MAVRELRSLGISAEPTVWDDPRAPWSELSAVVLRSTWDYPVRLPDFLAWIDRTAERLPIWNSPATVRWNAHKGYLLDLERRGIGVVPTEVVRVREPRTLSEIVADRGWSDVVLKPAVGSNALDLRVVRSDDLPPGEETLRYLRSRGDALVQPRLRRLIEAGERSLVFFNGEFSHAAEYPHVLDGGPRTGTPTAVDDGTLEAALRAIASAPEPPLYARVDFLPRDDSGWWLSELELIEPYLFLGTDPKAPGRFARAVADRLGRSS